MQKQTEAPKKSLWEKVKQTIKDLLPKSEMDMNNLIQNGLTNAVKTAQETKKPTPKHPANNKKAGHFQNVVTAKNTDATKQPQSSYSAEELKQYPHLNEGRPDTLNEPENRGRSL